MDLHPKAVTGALTGASVRTEAVAASRAASAAIDGSVLGRAGYNEPEGAVVPPAPVAIIGTHDPARDPAIGHNEGTHGRVLRNDEECRATEDSEPGDRRGTGIGQRTQYWQPWQQPQPRQLLSPE